jgi:bis(5'-nucleosyl)-tetraphosphatase (symmetrical)
VARVFVGDVQGCDDELGDLLDALRYDPTAHELWFVGDLVNRGPHSVRVLRRARALGADSVLGNHELNLLRVVAGDRPLRPRDSLDALLAAPDRDELLAWVRQRPLVKTWDDLVVVHAGLPPRLASQLRKRVAPLEAELREGTVPWDDTLLRQLVTLRFCDAKGNQPDDDEEPGEGYAPWFHFYRGERRVVFGHWSRRGLVVDKQLRGLDTGCVWGGKLTAWIAEEDRFVSVPARRAYQSVDA